MRATRLGLSLLAILAAACGRGGGGARGPESASFRTVGIGAFADPTVRGARVLPESVDETQSYGNEPDGGVRAITAGLRVVTTPKGGIQAAEDRLPQAPAFTTSLPDRLGGGFLFVLGTSVWRADRWLATAKPIYTSPQAITSVVAGLDRVYLRGASSYSAIDGKTGQALDLGPWPQGPYVSSFAAADGWRAAAITDLRGVVATFDAGATWRVLDLPMDARQVLVSGDGIAVGGVENARCENAWFEVRADGSIARLGGAPREAKGKTMACAPPPRTYYPGGYYPGTYPTYPTPPAPPPAPSAAAKNDKEPKDETAQSAANRVFGKRPIAAALEDGWPLTDGTAVVARDGALGRVRLSDGVMTELALGAFPLKPARCHPVSLTRPSAVGAFGFVCGEPRGATVIYAYDPMQGRLSEIKRFDRPRTITSSGNGAVAVRGSCAEDADVAPPTSAPRIEPLKDEKSDKDKDRARGRDRNGKDKEASGDRSDDKDADKASDKNDKDTLEKAKAAEAERLASEVHPYCVLAHDNVWREIHVRGAGGAERVVVLSDGRIVVVSPPQAADAPPRLTVLDKGRATTVPVAFPKVTADVGRVLRLGVWLDGFEERRPGVVGGWIEAGGSLLGVEIALDGKGTPGQYIRDAGMPFVSGRYGLGWTSSRRGYETTDGGMTWTSIDLPEPIVPISRVERRACGPIGCLAAGWMRVGWGESKKKEAPPVPPATYRASGLSAPTLALACEPLAPSPPPAPAPKPKPAPTPSVTLRPTKPHHTFGGPPVLGAAPMQGQTELPAFQGHAAVALRDAERGMNFEVAELPHQYPKLGSLARIYAWGPKTGDWDTQGKWQVKWLSPFAGWPETKTSASVLPPQLLLDFTKTSAYSGYTGYYSSYTGLWQFATGDDPSHALVVARRITRTEVALIELEADRAPVEIKRADGEPFTEVDGIVRAAGRWFVATPPSAGAFPPATTIWQLDGAVARELARVPRAGIGEGSRSAQQSLARRSDGRAIGLVVDGQPTAERSTATRWLLPIDVDSGQLGEPELLGYTDLAGRTLDACADDVVGWVLDTPLSGVVRLKLPKGSGSLGATYARLRMTGARVCVERISGNYDGQSAERAAQLTRPGATAVRGPIATRPGEILAAATSAQIRYPLKCTVSR